MICRHIEIKGRDFPIDEEQLGKLFFAEGSTTLVFTADDVPRCYFTSRLSKSHIEIIRFAVELDYLDSGIFEQFITVATTPPASIGVVVSENEIGRQPFTKLLSLGFEGAGVVQGAFSEEFGSVADGVRLVRPKEVAV